MNAYYKILGAKLERYLIVLDEKSRYEKKTNPAWEAGYDVFCFIERSHTDAIKLYGQINI